MFIIFWDYDGTLVDTETIYKDSLISFLKNNNYSLKEITDDFFYKNIAGKHPEEFLEKLEQNGFIKPNLNIDPLDIKKYYTIYFDNLKPGEIKITPNIDSVIDNLSKNKNVIMCIASSTFRHDFVIKYKNVQNKIFNENFDIDKNIYLCGEIEGCKFKPSSDIYVYTFNDIVKKYNLNQTKNDKLVIVEDSIAGCKAGHDFKTKYEDKIDINVIGYLGGSVIDNSSLLLENGADIIIRNANELDKYLSNNSI